MERLKDKIALITGGASGFGAAFARTFSAEGSKVIIADIADRAGEMLAQEIKAAGGESSYLHLDVAAEADWELVLAEIQRRYGRLDILVNNAGVVPKPAPIDQRKVEEWDRVMAVNARGVFLGTKHAIPAMRAAGGGSIVNISSLAALGQGQLMEAAYGASKGAVRTLTKITAAQHARDGIRCNSVHPGPIDAGMIGTYDPQALERRLQRVPMGRLGKVAEVVACVVFLASDESSYTTGTELLVDGGAAVQ